MNFLQIYNRVCFKVWGNSNVPQGTADNLMGEFGIIADVHQRIQEDRTFWFMEAESTISVVSGTRAYALPTGFKALVNEGLRFIDSDTLEYREPLSYYHARDAYAYDRDADTVTADYPTHYEIFGGELLLHPMPGASKTLHIRSYNFLPRPTANPYTAADTDALTQYGHNVIINMAAAEMCTILNELKKAQVFELDALKALESLKTKDHQMRRSMIRECRYRGIG